MFDVQVLPAGVQQRREEDPVEAVDLAGSHAAAVEPVAERGVDAPRAGRAAPRSRGSPARRAALARSASGSGAVAAVAGREAQHHGSQRRVRWCRARAGHPRSRSCADPAVAADDGDLVGVAGRVGVRAGRPRRRPRPRSPGRRPPSPAGRPRSTTVSAKTTLSRTTAPPRRPRRARARCGRTSPRTRAPGETGCRTTSAPSRTRAGDPLRLAGRGSASPGRRSTPWSSVSTSWCAATYWCGWPRSRQ